MSQLSVQEAADRVGVVRQTIFKKIKQGKLSATQDHRGVMQIDVSELLRVFGRLQPLEDTTGDSRGDKRSQPMSPATSVLQLELERAKMHLQLKEKELEMAQERIEDLKSREQEFKARERAINDEKQQLLAVIDRQTLLLAAPRPARAKPAAKAPAPAPVVMVKKPAAKAAARPAAKTQAKVVAKPTATATATKAKPAAAKKPAATRSKPVVKKATKK